MRVLRRTAKTDRTPAGYAHQGTLVTVPDEMAERLLATGEWHDETPGRRDGRKRVTEVPTPTPVTPPVTENTGDLEPTEPDADDADVNDDDATDEPTEPETTKPAKKARK